jgi:acyl-CoA reductase-like NAD-dependent aldehyde dehydrogenase
MTVPDITSFIDGADLPAVAAASRLDVIDPATEQVVARIVQADAAEVNRAVQAARRAFETGPWRRAGAAERQKALRAIAAGLLADVVELARLETLTTGLPITQTRGMIARAASVFEFFADFIGQYGEQIHRQEKGFLTLITREPRGVAALISPWNAPVFLSSVKIAGAIGFGNSCVLKPSEQTPLSLQRLVHIIAAAGVPPGVVNLVNGAGAVTGAALVAHPEVDVVSFTGGTDTGRRIAAVAAGNLRPCATELGGKSAAIVFADADLDRALDGVLFSIFAHNGEACLASARILLQATIAEAFTAKFLDRARNIRVGDPMDPTTELGPLVTAAHCERVLSYIDIATGQGARLLNGGRRDGPGYYVDPIVVRAEDNGLQACQEEIFGPFATIQTFHDADEAFAIANDSRFGLVSYVWTESLKVATRAMSEIRAGTTWINTPLMRDMHAGFGGFKDSGLGRESGWGSLEIFTEMKATIIGDGTTPMGRLGLGQR